MNELTIKLPLETYRPNYILKYLTSSKVHQYFIKSMMFYINVYQLNVIKCKYILCLYSFLEND